MMYIQPDAQHAVVHFRRGCCRYLIVALRGRLYLQRPTRRTKRCNCEASAIMLVAQSGELGLWDRDVEDPREDAWT
jgi:hypothetical protein